MLDYAALSGGLVEARPARAGVEFGVRIKQRLPTANAVIHPRLVIVPVSACECTLRPGFPRYVVLLLRQLLPPLGVRFSNLFCDFLSHLDEPQSGIFIADD